MALIARRRLSERPSMTPLGREPSSIEAHRWSPAAILSHPWGQGTLVKPC
jgi:hypothetical protein